MNELQRLFLIGVAIGFGLGVCICLLVQRYLHA